jgi:hypothetical protein
MSLKQAQKIPKKVNAPRNLIVRDMLLTRKGGRMRDKRSGRGGGRNRFRDIESQQFNDE